MTLRFTKFHGWGNDFFVVDEADLGAVHDLGAFTRALCDRRRGLGADGLLVIGAADGFDARMTLINADGSRAMMSGNGIRCFAHALVRNRGLDGHLHIVTDAGARAVDIRPVDDSTIDATVDMGGITPIDPPQGWNELGVNPDRPVAHLSLGNPHTVVGVDDVSAVDLRSLGRQVPDTNLEILQPGPEPNAVTMRVHERGAGITSACGTGASASAWAAVQWGLVPASAEYVLVHMEGGTAQVELLGERRDQARLTGPSVFVATVDVDLVAHEGLAHDASAAGRP